MRNISQDGTKLFWPGRSVQSTYNAKQLRNIFLDLKNAPIQGVHINVSVFFMCSRWMFAILDKKEVSVYYEYEKN